ncbi:MAG TPA: hypothetical protein G4O15_11025 [Dehalococcoidia bacterium]|nr:hypothetical protein [Dehalococcoidia bacterium]
MKKKILIIFLIVLIIFAATLSSASANGEVCVDIKPGSDPNPVNVKSKGVLPIAILGDESFDITAIDPSTVQLASPLHDDVVADPLRWSYEDTNGDGYTDLLLRYKTQVLIPFTVTTVAHGDEMELQIVGELKAEFGGIPIVGSDVIIVLNKMYNGD